MRTSGFWVSLRSWRSSSSGCIHSSPFCIVFFNEASLSTTVHVQHPNRLFPQDGVLVSTTSGHSAALAFWYSVSRSRLLDPHGLGCCSK